MDKKDQLATRAALGVLVVWAAVTLYAAVTNEPTVAIATGPLALAAAGFLFGYRSGKPHD